MFGFSAFAETPFATLPGLSGNVYNVSIAEAVDALASVASIADFFVVISELSEATDQVNSTVVFSSAILETVEILD